MILGFKEIFKEPIKAGTKIHTIREDKKDRWKKDNRIHFSTGVRTPKFECFKEGKCTGTQTIKIIYDNIPPVGNTVSVIVDGKNLSFSEIESLAKNDGFEDISDFLEWFSKDFKGKIIHWTEFRY